MKRIKRRNYRLCERCHCSLDAGEGRFCSDCLAEIKEEETYAKRWNLTMEQASSAKRFHRTWTSSTERAALELYQRCGSKGRTALHK